MSEYQYYEFQAIDRALTQSEQDAVAGLSSRAEVGPFQAVFTYSYGDFRGNPEKVLAKYFDALLYLANWGSRWLYFRFPKQLITKESLAPYCVADLISIRESDDFVILAITIDEEGGDWIEGDGELSPLVPIRQQILDGDYRALYLAWLKASEFSYPEDTAGPTEPPVPAGLADLSPPLEALVAFFDINPDLLTVAAQASPAAPSEIDLEPLLPRLPVAEQTELLRQLLRGDPGVTTQLKRRLKEIGTRSPAAVPKNPPPRPRQLSDLLAKSEQMGSNRTASEQQAAEAARLAKLDALAEREASVWELAAGLIAQKKIKAYDEAVTHLKELQELAQHRHDLAGFTARIQTIRQQYPSLSGLRYRLKQAGLLPYG